ncbi:hypothetical protein RFI_00616 [Reticulomyxa filosa]|uniref:PDZ domain-containing protein n=1 Tax=Reticulomyxa filosa TaxID=46433 RepID=X6PD94_RETFI|nr:hypothetical protein RFI_00616 [Reticulomyxa filosa]|eukprot:ETO36445.1 hypothetical protein RFI_00616 [Reticulomyxa filosa]
MATSTPSSALRRRRETRELAEAHFVNLLLRDSENSSNGMINFDNQSQKVEKPMSNVIKDTSEKKPQGTQNGSEKANAGGVVRSRRGTIVRHWNPLQQSTLSNENKTTKCEVTFKYRPFGFSISADENGLNAIITKVYTSECIKKGLCVGYCVAQVNGEFVLDKPHSAILEMLQTFPLPCRLTFIDVSQFEFIPFQFHSYNNNNNNIYMYMYIFVFCFCL